MATRLMSLASLRRHQVLAGSARALVVAVLPLACSSASAPSADDAGGAGGLGSGGNGVGGRGSGTGAVGGGILVTGGASGTGGAGATGGSDDLPPVCGDGLINREGEVCDDGNAQSGDGCTAECTQVEANHACPTPGSPCVTTVHCGDSVVAGSETCDDGGPDPVSGDGCSD